MVGENQRPYRWEEIKGLKGGRKSKGVRLGRKSQFVERK